MGLQSVYNLNAMGVQCRPETMEIMIKHVSHSLIALSVWFEKWLYKYNIKRHHVLSSHAGIFVSKQSAGVSSSVHRRQLRQKMFKMSTRGGGGAMGDEE